MSIYANGWVLKSKGRTMTMFAVGADSLAQAVKKYREYYDENPSILASFTSTIAEIKRPIGKTGFPIYGRRPMGPRRAAGRLRHMP